MKTPHVSPRFTALKNLGKLLSWIGGVASSAGLLVIFILTVQEQSYDEDFVYLVIATGVALILSGFMVVVIGQAVSCFVAIEENTRATFILMDTLLEKVNGAVETDPVAQEAETVSTTGDAENLDAQNKREVAGTSSREKVRAATDESHQPKRGDKGDDQLMTAMIVIVSLAILGFFVALAFALG